MKALRALVFAVLLTAAALPVAAQQAAVPGASRLHVAPKPADVRPDWKPLIGEYEHGNTRLNVLERDARLFLSTRPGSVVEMHPSGPGTFTAGDQQITFGKNAQGVQTLELGGEPYSKRLLGDVSHSFRIAPVRPVDELRKEALKAKPPTETGKRLPDLVELTPLDPGIKTDIRYAGSNNFMGTPFYTETRAFLQRSAAEALVRANRELHNYGYGLLIHDAYRPWFVTKMFWDATPNDKKDFVADPAKGSNHNRGTAVDVSLYSLQTGQEIEMPGGYDEMSDRSHVDYAGGTSLQRWCRDLLRTALEAQGFNVYKVEWWHFDYKGWASYPILNLPFSALSSRKQ